MPESVTLSPLNAYAWYRERKARSAGTNTNDEPAPESPVLLHRAETAPNPSLRTPDEPAPNRLQRRGESAPILHDDPYTPTHTPPTPTAQVSALFALRSMWNLPLGPVLNSTIQPLSVVLSCIGQHATNSHGLAQLAELFELLGAILLSETESTPAAGTSTRQRQAAIEDLKWELQSLTRDLEAAELSGTLHKYFDGTENAAHIACLGRIIDAIMTGVQSAEDAIEANLRDLHAFEARGWNPHTITLEARDSLTTEQGGAPFPYFPGGWNPSIVARIEEPIEIDFPRPETGFYPGQFGNEPRAASSPWPAAPGHNRAETFPPLAPLRQTLPVPTVGPPAEKNFSRFNIEPHAASPPWLEALRHDRAEHFPPPVPLRPASLPGSMGSPVETHFSRFGIEPQADSPPWPTAPGDYRSETSYPPAPFRQASLPGSTVGPTIETHFSRFDIESQPDSPPWQTVREHHRAEISPLPAPFRQASLPASTVRPPVEIIHSQEAAHAIGGGFGGAGGSGIGGVGGVGEGPEMQMAYCNYGNTVVHMYVRGGTGGTGGEGGTGGNGGLGGGTKISDGVQTPLLAPLEPSVSPPPPLPPRPRAA